MGQQFTRIHKQPNKNRVKIYGASHDAEATEA